VDAVGQISLVFVLREHSSLFFLSRLMDVSMSRAQYSCGFQGLGWTQPMPEQMGFELTKSLLQAGSGRTKLRLMFCPWHNPSFALQCIQ
jgi:hypothetical protein